MEQKPRDVKTTLREQNARPRLKIGLSSRAMESVRVAYCSFSRVHLRAALKQSREFKRSSPGASGASGRIRITAPGRPCHSARALPSCRGSPGEEGLCEGVWGVSERRRGVGQEAVGRAAQVYRRPAWRSVVHLGGQYEISMVEHTV